LKRLIIILITMCAITAFPQVSLVGKLNYILSAGMSESTIPGRINYFYYSFSQQSNDGVVDSININELKAYLPLYVTNNFVVDIITGGVIYSWGRTGNNVDIAFINPGCNAIRYFTQTYNAGSKGYSYSIYSSGTYADPILASTGKQSTTFPGKLLLQQNYPNPFNPSTTIQYSLPSPNHVTIRIFNIKGQLVKSLVDADKSSGGYIIQWDGKTDGGMKAASGVYFYCIKAGESKLTREMVMVK